VQHVICASSQRDCHQSCSVINVKEQKLSIPEEDNRDGPYPLKTRSELEWGNCWLTQEEDSERNLKLFLDRCISSHWGNHGDNTTQMIWNEHEKWHSSDPAVSATAARLFLRTLKQTLVLHLSQTVRPSIFTLWSEIEILFSQRRVLITWGDKP
jgi:hypothetical protein